MVAGTTLTPTDRVAPALRKRQAKAERPQYSMQVKPGQHLVTRVGSDTVPPGPILEAVAPPI